MRFESSRTKLEQRLQRTAEWERDIHNEVTMKNTPQQYKHHEKEFCEEKKRTGEGERRRVRGPVPANFASRAKLYFLRILSLW